MAGMAGALSLTEARAGPLVGVFISVTTIPAVAAMGVHMAAGNWPTGLGSDPSARDQRGVPDRGRLGDDAGPAPVPLARLQVHGPEP